AGGVATEQPEVAVDLVVAGEVSLQRALVALEYRQGEAVDLAVPVLRPMRIVAPPPQPDVQCRRNQRKHDGGEQGMPAVVIGCGGAQKNPRRSLRDRRWNPGSLTNAGHRAQ